MLIISNNNNCSTQEMLPNGIRCVRDILVIKAKIIITSLQSAFHNFIVIYKVQHHRATRYQCLPRFLVFFFFLVDFDSYEMYL